jgi:hypothetical protein
MENGEILELIVGEEWASFCTVFGIRIEDKCSAADNELPVLNDPVTGDADRSGESIATPNETCSIGGANAGVKETDELSELSLVNGELLTVSSE